MTSPAAPKLCSKLVFLKQNDTSQTIILGIITQETKTHIFFKTSKNTYYIPKEQVISLEPTDTVFRNGDAN